MNPEAVISGVLALLGGAAAAKVVDTWGKRQELTFSERQALRVAESTRIDALEQRLDEMTARVDGWQAKYYEAVRHAERCETELAGMKLRVADLERRIGEAN